MELALILLIIIVSAVLVVFIVIHNRKKNEEMRYFAAAGNIMRDDILDYSLKNPLANDGSIKEPNGRKTMVYIKTVGNKNARYVFDPEKCINIGRDKNNSNIYINDNAVSKNHCCIYAKSDHVYVKDGNSVNGTLLMRSWRRRYEINGGAKAELRSGDRIKVGPCVFKVLLFYYDISQV